MASGTAVLCMCGLLELADRQLTRGGLLPVNVAFEKYAISKNCTETAHCHKPQTTTPSLSFRVSSILCDSSRLEPADLLDTLG